MGALIPAAIFAGALAFVASLSVPLPEESEEGYRPQSEVAEQVRDADIEEE